MIEIDLRSKIREFIVDVFAFGDESVLVSDDASLLEGHVLDSTDVLELIVFLEGRFQIKVEDEEVVPENFDSVNKLHDFATRKLGH
jgi:acyl carrier protein